MEPLNGYVVVDLSTGIAGAYCTKLLADGGAEVIKVEPPEGDPLRRWSASGAEIAPGDDGALFSFLACSKHSVVADPETDVDFVNALLADADAVVWSRGSTVAEHRAFTPAEIHRVHPHLTVTAITPFGLEGPWKDRPATEFTLQAWSGGIVGLGRGSADRAPVFVGGQVGEYLAGAYASAATMASRMRGAAELIDLSMLEAQILGLTYYPVTYYEMLGRPWRDARRLTVPGHRAGQGRPDRHRLRHGAAVVRPVRHDRTSGLDRRRVAAVDHRAGQREVRRTLRMGREPNRRRDPRSRDGVPDSQRPGRQRRQRRIPRPLPGARVVHHPIRATAFLSPGRRIACSRRGFVHRSRRRASANTPSTTAEMEFRVVKARA